MEFKSAEVMNWEEQFKMMKRWYYRLRGNTNDLLGSGWDQDFFIAFFITCDNFREWLINDGKTTREEINTYVSNHDEILGLCHEIANFSKHVVLKPHHIDPNTKVVGRELVVGLTTGPTYIISTLQIESPGRNIKTHDAFKLAEDCMNLWGNFLISKNLPIPDMPKEYIYENFTKWEPKSLNKDGK